MRTANIIPTAKLSKREHEILTLLANGYTAKEISFRV